MKKVLVCLLTLTLMSLSAWAGTWTSGSTTITTSGSTLTVSGNGAMADYSYSDATPWISDAITTIVIEDGVTHLGAYAFPAENATSVTIPVSVTSIGSYAFYGCSNMTNIYYAGSPNDWASITFADYRANPFVNSSISSRKFYFNGCNVGTQMLTFLPGLTEIKDHAFYNAKITDINIPGTVERIGNYALRCSVSGTVCINRTTPPTTGTSSITFGGSAKIYVPSGSTSAYNKTPWNSVSRTAQAVSGSTLGDYGANVKWSLGEDGVLTLDASGSSASKNITIDAASTTKMPWYYFRRLVYKIKLKGEITAINNTLHYHYGISEIVLDQNTIPSVSPTYIATGSSTPYASLFDPCHPLTLRIKLSSLLSPTQAAKLETAPWNDGHWQIAIDDEVVVDENSADNLELFDAIQTHVDVPFTMRLERSVSNAYYNTFCSPIDLDAETVEATFGAGTQIHELASTSYDEEANELTLEFADSQNHMEAGVPYLFKPANSVSNPTFTDVDPTAVATAEGEVNAPHVTFFGTLEPVEVTSSQIDAKNFIFLLANNQLTWANGGTLKAMRAYWLLKDGVPSRALSRRPIMRIGQSAQGIEEVSGDWRQETGDGKQVTGRKVLRDGQLIIVHEGVEYNAQGIRL